jgi:hypothetical protein
VKHGTLIVFTALCTLGGSLTARQYRCDWSVVAQAGGDMSSTTYRCGSTAGQTAAGQLTGPSYWAHIGFWQIDVPVGIREEAHWPNQGPLVTRLYAPQPNPSRAHAAIRYSLAGETRAQVQVHDLTGRLVRTLVDAMQKPGRYALRWDGRDNAGRPLSNGIYFCRMNADDYRATEKLVLQR